MLGSSGSMKPSNSTKNIATSGSVVSSWDSIIVGSKARFLNASLIRPRLFAEPVLSATKLRSSPDGSACIIAMTRASSVSAEREGKGANGRRATIDGPLPCSRRGHHGVTWLSLGKGRIPTVALPSVT